MLGVEDRRSSYGPHARSPCGTGLSASRLSCDFNWSVICFSGRMATSTRRASGGNPPCLLVAGFGNHHRPGAHALVVDDPAEPCRPFVAAKIAAVEQENFKPRLRVSSPIRRGPRRSGCPPPRPSRSGTSPPKPMSRPAWAMRRAPRGTRSQPRGRVRQPICQPVLNAAAGNLNACKPPRWRPASKTPAC